MKVLVLNKNNIIDGTNNSKYRYKFTSTVNFKKGSKIALSKLNMYFSWENITSTFNNQTFSYTWWDSSGNQTKTYSLTIPQGYYSIDDINDWMYSELVNRGHFLTYSAQANAKGTSNGTAWSASTKYVFIELMENPTYYSCQFRLYALPAYVATGATYTKPADVTGYAWRVPSSTVVGVTTYYPVPKVVISSTNNFDDIVGFNSGTYGDGQITTSNGFQDFLSNYTPTIDPTGSVLVTCSLANNMYASPRELIDSFTYTVDYGGMISVENNNLNWIEIAEGSYSEFYIEFKNQNFGQMVIKDPNSIILMVIEEPNE